MNSSGCTAANRNERQEDPLDGPPRPRRTLYHVRDPSATPKLVAADGSFKLRLSETSNPAVRENRNLIGAASRRVARPSSAWAGPLTFFSSQTSGSPITDIQPAVRDNKNLIGAARSAPVSQDGPRSCPKPIFSAL